MVCHFRGKVGEERVIEKRYCIAQSKNGTLVEAQGWESVATGGEALIMSMVVKREWVEDLAKTCPKCGKTELGTYLDQGWRVWCVASWQTSSNKRRESAEYEFAVDDVEPGLQSLPSR